MIIRLQDLRQGPREYDVRLDPADLHLAAEGVAFPEPVAGRVRFQLFGERVRVTGHVKTRIETPCVRCLEPLVLPVDTEVRLRLLRVAPAPLEGETELTEDDLETVYVEGEELDTLQLVREQLQLNIPMRSLCKDSCLGLCPTCGVNRNSDPCECDQTEVDPRWEGLQALRDR